MYSSSSSKENRTRPNNLGLRNSAHDWRNRPVSPSNTKRTASPDNRRPLSSSGQSVAALQQHHQWLMQQQQQDTRSLNNTSPIYRSISPAPKSMSKQQQQSYNNDGDDVVFDEVDEEDEEVDHPRSMSVQDTRARSPSINKGSGGSIMSSATSAHFYPSTSTTQEFKVVKEGWLYRKNGLMQWKPVYAVAKHGNAIKPGGLYLYKDLKCTSHIYTYDMSQVLEISPRAQDYKQGIKWEFRMLVKRDDVILATDDMLSRKDWIDSLTSIMGKVSIATQNELTSRIASSEQMNRDLQGVAEDLDAENAQLKEQIQTLKETATKRDKFFQQELQNRESELKETFAKKERGWNQRLQEREQELMTEMDRQRQTLETKCEIFEREAMQWRTKYGELEKMASPGELETVEIRKWRHRVDELELELRQLKTATQDTASTKLRTMGSLDNDTLTDVKFNLQLLRDQLKSSDNGSLSDVKSSIVKLCDTLEEAKTGWSDLQGDIVKFLQTEKEDTELKDSKQKHTIDLLRAEFMDLREDLVGVSDKEATKTPSLSEKFDILIDMMENLQINQSRLSTVVMDNHGTSSSASTTSSDGSMPTTPTLSYIDKDSDLYKAVTSQQQQLSDWIKESREIQSSTLTTIEKTLQPSDMSRLHDKVAQTIEHAMTELAKAQQEGQDEQAKSIKIIGNYLQLISNDIQESAIPDLSALSQQLEDVVERLNMTEERLSSLREMPSQGHSNDTMSLKNISADNLSDDDKLAQLCHFVKNTERFMERSLRILAKYNNSDMEETIRRAVKGASKAHLEQVLVLQEQNKDERELIEKKMQRYEENARNYFEKSMEKMHTDLHEFTGVMYEMLERLVLKALEHSPSVMDEDYEDTNSSKSVQSVLELYGKLSGMNQALKMEVQRLENEKEELEKSVKTMKKTSHELEREIDERHAELRSVKAEYDRVHREMKRSRQEGASDLARELEPLMHQIAKLRKMASLSDDMSDAGYVDLGHEVNPKSTRSKSPLPSSNRRSRYDETDLDCEDEEDRQQDNSSGRKLRFPTMTRTRRSSFTSQYSDNNSEHSSYSGNSRQYDQQSIKSPLIGSRPRGKSPLAGYLGGRK